MATRRTLLEQHDILCEERSDIEATIKEQRAYQSLSAQGSQGASTDFVNLDVIRRNLSQVLTDIATIERQLGL